MRLIVDGNDVAPVVTASTALQKMKGLLGRSSLEGAMYFPGVPSVHTFFMRMTIDVAFLDAGNVVQYVLTMKPWRVSGKHNGVRHVLEAEVGAFDTWNLVVGSRVAVQP
jgi:uncharacterized membrane protein (UPF0127 family)